MKKKEILTIFVLMVLVVGIILTVGWRVYQKRMPRVVELTGEITVVGNEPFTQVAIKMEDGSLYGIADDRVDELKKMQGEKVKVRGYLVKESTPLFRTEKNINVINFEVIK